MTERINGIPEEAERPTLAHLLATTKNIDPGLRKMLTRVDGQYHGSILKVPLDIEKLILSGTELTKKQRQEIRQRLSAGQGAGKNHSHHLKRP